MRVLRTLRTLRTIAGALLVVVGSVAFLQGLALASGWGNFVAGLALATVGLSLAAGAAPDPVHPQSRRPHVP